MASPTRWAIRRSPRQTPKASCSQAQNRAGTNSRSRFTPFTGRRKSYQGTFCNIYISSRIFFYFCFWFRSQCRNNDFNSILQNNIM